MSQKKIVTEKLVFGGDCIAKIDGKTVFVPFSLPNETLLVEITESHRDYDRARIVEIIEPSPHRIVPPCPLYGKCGGCNFMHCESSAQTEYRKNSLRDCFVRAGIPEEKIPDIEVIAGPDFGYRARFQFTDGGLMVRGTKNVIQLEKCLVAEDAVNRWLSATPKESRPRGRVHVFGSKFSGGSVIVSEESGTRRQNGTYAEPRRQKFKKPRQIFSGTIISPDNTAVVTLLGKNISFDVRGFFQSNMFVLEKALPKICNFATDSSVVDIYSGCGVFSAFLADSAKNVVLVEHNRDALVFAEQNIAGKPHASYGISGAKWAESAKTADFENVVIDPPRSGMEREVLKMICEKKPRHVNAVSCNPSTHARDIAEMLKSGYSLEKLFLLDFYPQTSHVESLACLTAR